MKAKKTTKGTRRTIFIYLLILVVFYVVIYIVPQVSDIFVETYTAEYRALQVEDKTTCLFVRNETVYRADRKQYLSSEQRWELFLDKLDGKALTTESVEQNNYLKGSQRLRPEEIRFEDEIQWNGHLLEFYVPVYFDPDKVFGTEIATSGRDDYVNVYADYDLETQSVSEALTVILYRSDGSEDEFRYKLTEGEQEMFREKMNEYAVQSTSMDLSDWHEQYLMEIGREMIHGGSSLEIQII